MPSFSLDNFNLEGWAWDWDWRELAGNLTIVEQTKKAFNTREFVAAEGLLDEDQDISPHFPVILIPGASHDSLSLTLKGRALMLNPP